MNVAAACAAARVCAHSCWRNRGIAALAAWRLARAAENGTLLRCERGSIAWQRRS